MQQQAQTGQNQDLIKEGSFKYWATYFKCW